jgi:hypothetical protein
MLGVSPYVIRIYAKLFKVTFKSKGLALIHNEKKSRKRSFFRERAMRRYYLHTRYEGIFYAELIDPATGRKLAARSTGTKNRDEALPVISISKPPALPGDSKSLTFQGTWVFTLTMWGL